MPLPICLLLVDVGITNLVAVERVVGWSIDGWMVEVAFEDVNVEEVDIVEVDEVVDDQAEVIST